MLSGRSLFYTCVKCVIAFSIIVLIWEFYYITKAIYIPQFTKNRKTTSILDTRFGMPSSTLPKTVKPRKFILTLEGISTKIQQINFDQNVQNQHLYGENQDYSIVILVQVHKRIEYLKFLIESLSKAYDIEKALLIFSHDYYSDDINMLIENIKFCRVMQIFYPYSIQLYPNTFPGSDPKDCSRDTPHNESLARKCPNAFFTDLGGKYRVPGLVQIRHHWWWKANQVFKLQATRAYNGPVLFLEEDLYLVGDFISMIEFMVKKAKDDCKNCKIFSLASNADATNTRTANYKKSNYAVITSLFNNMGFSFNREVWGEILSCAKVYCTFDDYNYDITLNYIFTNCMTNTAAIHLYAPRVFHLGECGVHFTSGNCNASRLVSTIRNIITKNKHYLFPKKLVFTNRRNHMRSKAKYGGFADPRDHALCMGMTSTS